MNNQPDTKGNQITFDGNPIREPYCLVVDLDNMLIEARKLLFLGYSYDSVGHTICGEPISVDQNSIFEKAVGEFPESLLSIISDEIGYEPETIVVAADWERLTHSIALSTVVRDHFEQLGAEILSPKQRFPKFEESGKEDRDAIDAEIRYSVIENTLLNQGKSYSKVVVASGDHFVARLYDFTKKHRADLNFNVATFFNALSRDIKKRIENSAKEKLIYLELSPMFKELQKELKFAFASTPKILDIKLSIQRTTIFRLNEAQDLGMPYVASAELLRWIDGWLAYYDDVWSTRTTWSNNQLFDELKEDGIILVKKKTLPDGKKIRRAVNLNHDNSLVQHYCQEYFNNPKRYEAEYVVAPRRPRLA